MKPYISFDFILHVCIVVRILDDLTLVRC